MTDFSGGGGTAAGTPKFTEFATPKSGRSVPGAESLFAGANLAFNNWRGSFPLSATPQVSGTVMDIYLSPQPTASLSTASTPNAATTLAPATTAAAASGAASAYPLPTLPLPSAAVQLRTAQLSAAAIAALPPARASLLNQLVMPILSANANANATAAAAAAVGGTAANGSGRLPSPPPLPGLLMPNIARAANGAAPPAQPPTLTASLLAANANGGVDPIALAIGAQATAAAAAAAASTSHPKKKKRRSDAAAAGGDSDSGSDDEHHHSSHPNPNAGKAGLTGAAIIPAAAAAAGGGVGSSGRYVACVPCGKRKVKCALVPGQACARCIKFKITDQCIARVHGKFGPKPKKIKTEAPVASTAAAAAGGGKASGAGTASPATGGDAAVLSAFAAAAAAAAAAVNRVSSNPSAATSIPRAAAAVGATSVVSNPAASAAATAVAAQQAFDVQFALQQYERLLLARHQHDQQLLLQQQRQQQIELLNAQQRIITAAVNSRPPLLSSTVTASLSASLVPPGAAASGGAGGGDSPPDLAFGKQHWDLFSTAPASTAGGGGAPGDGPASPVLALTPLPPVAPGSPGPLPLPPSPTNAFAASATSGAALVSSAAQKINTRNNGELDLNLLSLDEWELNELDNTGGGGGRARSPLRWNPAPASPLMFESPLAVLRTVAPAANQTPSANAAATAITAAAAIAAAAAGAPKSSPKASAAAAAAAAAAATSATAPKIEPAESAPAASTGGGASNAAASAAMQLLRGDDGAIDTHVRSVAQRIAQLMKVDPASPTVASEIVQLLTQSFVDKKQPVSGSSIASSASASAAGNSGSTGRSTSPVSSSASIHSLSPVSHFSSPRLEPHADPSLLAPPNSGTDPSLLKRLAAPPGVLRTDKLAFAAPKPGKSVSPLHYTSLPAERSTLAPLTSPTASPTQPVPAPTDDPEWNTWWTADVKKRRIPPRMSQLLLESTIALPVHRIRKTWVTAPPAAMFNDHYYVSMARKLSPGHSVVASHFSEKLFSAEARAQAEKLPKVVFHWVPATAATVTSTHEPALAAVGATGEDGATAPRRTNLTDPESSMILDHWTELPAPFVRHIPSATAPVKRSRTESGREVISYEYQIHMNRAAEELTGYNTQSYIDLFDGSTTADKLFHPNDWRHQCGFEMRSIELARTFHRSQSLFALDNIPPLVGTAAIANAKLAAQASYAAAAAAGAGSTPVAAGGGGTSGGSTMDDTASSVSSATAASSGSGSTSLGAKDEEGLPIDDPQCSHNRPVRSLLKEIKSEVDLTALVLDPAASQQLSVAERAAAANAAGSSAAGAASNAASSSSSSAAGASAAAAAPEPDIITVESVLLANAFPQYVTGLELADTVTKRPPGTSQREFGCKSVEPLPNALEIGKVTTSLVGASTAVKLEPAPSPTNGTSAAASAASASASAATSGNGNRASSTTPPASLSGAMKATVMDPPGRLVIQHRQAEQLAAAGAAAGSGVNTKAPYIYVLIGHRRVALRYLSPGFTEKTCLVHLIHHNGSLIPTIATTKISFVLHQPTQKQLPLIEHCFVPLLSLSPGWASAAGFVSGPTPG